MIPWRPGQPISLGDVAFRRVVELGAGDDLQAALDRAQPGDKILLRADFVGNFVCRKLPLDAPIVLAGTGPEKLIARINAEPVIRFEPGAYGYVLDNFTISANASKNQAYTLVEIGRGADEQRTVEAAPKQIVLNRLTIRGGGQNETQRGISVNGADIVISDCSITDIYGSGYDTQAICGWNGPGPIYIFRTVCEAAGENIMFGGAAAASDELRPRNVVVSSCLLTKPLAWRDKWTVKNLLELKNVERIIIEDNVLQNCWLSAQVGFAIVIMSASDDPWSGSTDITIKRNLIENVGGGINIWPHAGDAPVRSPVKNVFIAHNTITVDGSLGVGRALQILGSADPQYNASDIVVVNNAFLGTGLRSAFVVTEYGPRNFHLHHNVFASSSYGFFRDGDLPFAAAFSGDVVLAPNFVIGDGGGRPWPTGTLFGASPPDGFGPAR
jgi:hypothetical protein